MYKLINVHVSDLPTLYIARSFVSFILFVVMFVSHEKVIMYYSLPIENSVLFSVQTFMSACGKNIFLGNKNLWWIQMFKFCVV